MYENSMNKVKKKKDYVLYSKVIGQTKPYNKPSMFASWQLLFVSFHLDFLLFWDKEKCIRKTSNI